MSYVTSIGEIRLSSKEKAFKHYTRHNFNLIVTKLYAYVGLIYIHVMFENQLCGPNRSARTFLQKNSLVHERGRNFDSIVIKFCT